MPRPRQTRIYQRPGRAGWYCDLDGTRRRISLGPDEETARQEFRRLLDGDRLRRLAPGSQAIAAVFAETRKRAEAANTPKTTYELHLNLKRVLAWLEGRGVTSTAQLDKQVVEDYKSQRRFAVSAGCVNRELSSWRRAVLVAVELGAIDEAAPSWFKRLREPRPEPHRKGFTKAQLARFIAAAPAGYRDLFRLALGSGMRDDEIRHMETGDLRDKWIVVTPKPGWTTKGYRHRKIPVGRATLAAARALLKARGVMKSEHRHALNLDSKKVWTVAKATCEAAGIPALSMHDLRRAWASHMLAAGHRIEDISRWLGHANILTTTRYLRVVDERHPGAKRLPW